MKRLLIVCAALLALTPPALAAAPTSVSMPTAPIVYQTVTFSVPVTINDYPEYPQGHADLSVACMIYSDARQSHFLGQGSTAIPVQTSGGRRNYDGLVNVLVARPARSGDAYRCVIGWGGGAYYVTKAVNTGASTVQLEGTLP